MLNRSLLAPVIQAAASHIAGKHTELGGNICYGNTVGHQGFKQIQNLHMPKYWALTGDFHGKKKKKNGAFCFQSPSAWSGTEAGMHKEFGLSLCNHQIASYLTRRHKGH